MLNRILFLLLILPLLTACNTYRRLSWGVGYIEMPVGPDGYQVSYVGNTNMSATEARRFALLRTAELAAFRNVPYFRITDERVLITYGTHYWPGSYTSFVETTPDHPDRTGLWVARVYDTGYMEYFTVPESRVQVILTSDPAAPSIPTAFLLQQAITDKIKLSPGVAEHMATLPPVTGTVTIPPPPTPTMLNPGTLDYQATAAAK